MILHFLSPQKCFIVLYYYLYTHNNCNSKWYHYYIIFLPVYLIFRLFWTQRGFFWLLCSIVIVLWFLVSQSWCCSCLFLCGIPGTYIPGFWYDELFVGLLYLYSCMKLFGYVVWVLDYVICSMVVPLHLCFIFMFYKIL